MFGYRRDLIQTERRMYIVSDGAVYQKYNLISILKYCNFMLISFFYILGLQNSKRPSSPLYNGTGFFLGVTRPGRDADPSPLLVPRSKNRGELYLYSP
jgi:hypothetical protein